MEYILHVLDRVLHVTYPKLVKHSSEINRKLKMIHLVYLICIREERALMDNLIKNTLRSRIYVIDDIYCKFISGKIDHHDDRLTITVKYVPVQLKLYFDIIPTDVFAIIISKLTYHHMLTSFARDEKFEYFVSDEIWRTLLMIKYPEVLSASTKVGVKSDDYKTLYYDLLRTGYNNLEDITRNLIKLSCRSLGYEFLYSNHILKIYLYTLFPHIYEIVIQNKFLLDSIENVCISVSYYKCDEPDDEDDIFYKMIVLGIIPKWEDIYLTDTYRCVLFHIRHQRFRYDYVIMMLLFDTSEIPANLSEIISDIFYTTVYDHKEKVQNKFLREFLNSYSHKIQRENPEIYSKLQQK